MKQRIRAFFRIETLIVIIILAAFSFIWIKWGKLTIYGWDLPFMYKKTTKISNTILFFSQKDSPHLAHFIYTVPVLGIISFLFLIKLKFRTANFLLFLTSILGFGLSLYMYDYMMSSKIFRLVNTGAGIHLLCGISFFGIIYTTTYIFRKRKKREKQDIESESNIEPVRPEIETENIES